MNEHLQRALIELYYAMAEFNQGHATDLSAEQIAQIADSRARLIVVKANLERLLLPLPEQAVEIRRTA
jgi:hypothetical protein